MIIVCSFPLTVAVLWDSEGSFIKAEEIVWVGFFYESHEQKPTPFYYEDDKQNFPMNDLGMFTPTNQQGKCISGSSEMSNLSI